MDAASLSAKIADAGAAVRDLKAKKASKEEITAAVATLLALKASYKEVTGTDYVDPNAPKPQEKKPKAAPAPAPVAADPNKKSKKELNKEAKKAKKAAHKDGDAPAPVAVAAPVTTKPLAVVAPVAGPTVFVQPPPAATETHTVYFSASHLPLISHVVATLLKGEVEIHFKTLTPPHALPVLVLPTGKNINGDAAIAKYLCRLFPDAGLYGVAKEPVLLSEIDSWVDYALGHIRSATVQTSAAFLDAVLAERTFLVGFGLTLADIAIFTALTLVHYEVPTTLPHLARWFTYLAGQSVFASAKAALLAVKPAKAAPAKTPKPSLPESAKGKTSGNCPPLEGAIVGQVVTRFPPEPSGYLHIGHIKACLLNDYYARAYQGKLIVRFDDTNPSKEKDEFEQAILADLARLNIKADMVTYTSDSFPQITELARQLIREGNGYMDNTSQEQMRDERMHGIESTLRNTDVATNLALFEKMLQGHPDADGYCLRGKIDMQAKNKTLRDPVFFRANATPHHRTGTKYKAYPTYDFACPIVDSNEGVTHALRTTEYNDRDAQYQWVLEALKLRKVRIHAFARMNFVHSVLSKRKLQWFVDEGIVEGWYDPRFPTVQGVLRRGVTVEALREFILSQGASRRIVDMEWDKFWTINKRVIDPIARRFFAIDAERAVRLNVHGLPFTGVQGLPTALHPKNPELGHTVKRLSSSLLIERDDANSFTVGEDVTLMRYGNVTITAINKNSDGEIVSVDAKDHPEGDFKKTKLKITWLAQVDDIVPATLVEFDHLISKPKLEENDNFKDHLTPVTRAEMHALGDHGLRNLQYGDVIQLERRGYFRVDSPYVSKDKPLVLFMIPDGKQRAMSTLSTNLAHR
ncbi:glutamyl-tRNA synthetase [Achlya hypogyna]|uniref:glutamate--tRNA ligase n=1 Tax=Achlya hypogyna TaxID=1202772 RepID=A0A1V9YRF8_ACHHY|nr:glutamyl-tRNA synthetase [Achlya hypogyna]